MIEIRSAYEEEDIQCPGPKVKVVHGLTLRWSQEHGAYLSEPLKPKSPGRQFHPHGAHGAKWDFKGKPR